MAALHWTLSYSEITPKKTTDMSRRGGNPLKLCYVAFWWTKLMPGLGRLIASLACSFGHRLSPTLCCVATLSFNNTHSDWITSLTCFWLICVFILAAAINFLKSILSNAQQTAKHRHTSRVGRNGPRVRACNFHSGSLITRKSRHVVHSTTPQQAEST